jgi:hypothetical protein
VSACGGDGSGEPAAAGSPPVAGGARCATTGERLKPVPPAARAVTTRFVAAVDRGDVEAARRLLVPAFVDDVLTSLTAVRRLDLVKFNDDY